jgi:hypothetical protein
MRRVKFNATSLVLERSTRIQFCLDRTRQVRSYKTNIDDRGWICAPEKPRPSVAVVAPAAARVAGSTLASPAIGLEPTASDAKFSKGVTFFAAKGTAKSEIMELEGRLKI